MEFALSTHLFVNERLSSHILDQILAAGIRQIEIFAARQHFDYHQASQVQDVAQWFTDHEVRLHSLHAPLFADKDWGRSGGWALSVAHLERRLRIDSMDEIKRAIEVAERLPFRYLILHIGLPNEAFDMHKFDAALTSIEHLRIFSKERGAAILLENIPNELTTPERLAQFIRSTHFDDLKVCFDTGHAHMGSGVRESFATLKDLVVSTHVHDNNREKDDHLLPFEGGINWEETVHDFRGVDGRFPVVFELRDYGPEKSGLNRVKAVMKKLEAIK